MHKISKLYQTILFNPTISETTLKEFQILLIAKFLKNKFNDNRSLSQLRKLIKDELKV